MNLKCINFGSFSANCYLLETKDALFVIDPFDLDERISSFLGAADKRPCYVLLTHCHYDHILGAKKIRDAFDVKLAIGERDALGLSDSSLSLSEYAGYNQEPFSADILFKNRDTLRNGDTTVEVIYTPGHTVGSVCYKIEDYIFTGDTLFAGTVGRTDLPSGDSDSLMRSLEWFKGLDKDYKLFAGHGLATTLSRELKTNPYLV